jgi:hypothetical protein
MARVLTLALTALWVLTLAFADTAVTPAMHCQRGHMPCCPESSTGESCSTARCTEQVPEKAEARTEQAAQDQAQASLASVPTVDLQHCAQYPVREPAAGRHDRIDVFRLKDDLRI